MALAPGTHLGPYEILTSLGAGGMGEVYRARDTRLNRDVAIKILPASFSEDAQCLDRFEREARILSALNHPNLLSIYDVGSQNSIHYLVSELLDGKMLRHRIQEGKIPGRKTLDYAVQIAKGLAAAHEKGVVHRDLKPENIFVTADGRIKILDFGLAKLNVPGDSEQTASRDSLTEQGTVMGTVGYMSPEQVRGNPADSRSDIFSFGAILYEMLTGTRAFKSNSSVETMHAILREDPPEIPTTDGKISPGTERVMRRCLEKASSERFQSACDLAFALEGLSGSSRTDTLAESPQRETKRHSWERNWKLWAFATGVLLMPLLATLWLRQPTRAATEFVQLTNDSHSKGRLGWPPPVASSGLFTDGSRLYFTVEASLGAGPTPAQVSVNGGETAPIHLPLPYAGIQLMDISPDGSELLLQGFNGAEVEVPEWIVPVTGGSPRRLDDLMAHDGAWSPDKRLVAFAAGDGLFLLDSNNEKRKIFTASGIVLWPRWSPDGKRLRFTVEDSSTASSALWEIRADGIGAHLLLPGWNKPSIECCGEWSRDGRYYVFQTGTFAHSDIWAVAEGFFDMSRPIQLTAGPLSFSSPSPSLDGKWLYAVGAQYRYETIRLDPSSGQITTLTSMPSLESLDYSRDGKWLAYVSFPDGILWRSRADGSDRLQLTYPPIMAASPQWSPDGTQVAFSRIRVGEPWQIDIVPAEGGSPQSVFPEARNQSSPAWSGDGQSLIFSRLPWLESGKNLPVRLEKVDLHSHKLSEIAGSEDMLTPSVSPDGKFLSALHTAAAQQLWIYDFGSAKWSNLSSTTGYRPAWTRDSSALYLITREGELQRYRSATGKLESVVKMPDSLPSFGLASQSLQGLAFLSIGLDGAPLVARDQGSSQIYAIKWQN
jgi:serine/threonine protein kinase/Tol biopolymer transport system component